MRATLITPPPQPPPPREVQVIMTEEQAKALIRFALDCAPLRAIHPTFLEAATMNELGEIIRDVLANGISA